MNSKKFSNLTKNKNKQKNIIIIFLFLTIFSYISPNKIVLPFSTKSYPFDPNDEFKYIFKNEIYTEIEVGCPPQIVELYLTMRTPFFIIKYNNSNPDYYKNVSSSSYILYDNYSTFFINDDVVKKGAYSGEKFFLQNSFNKNDKLEICEFGFIYGIEIDNESKRHMGVLGIQFFSTSSFYEKEVNFINSLKRNRLITNYVWNLNYTEDNKGYLIIGEYPHAFDSKKYDKEKLMQVNVRQEGAQKVEWNFYFDNIQYGETQLNGARSGKLAPQYGVILGTQLFDQLITKEFFNEYINNGQCERKTYDEKHDYYVCNENIDLSKFKSIEFTLKELSQKPFVLTKDDLFFKNNGKIYFLVAFGIDWKWKYSWTFGKPFMKKYNFLFDQDGKQILYYDQNVDDDSKSFVGNKTFVILLWIGVFVFLIVIGILVYCLMKILKERKKMLYELDDEFDYNVGGDNNNNNSNDDNNGKNRGIQFEGDNNENKFGI